MDGETDDVSQQLWESESYNADVERRQAAQKAILFGRAPIASGALEFSGGWRPGAPSRRVLLRSRSRQLRNRSLGALRATTLSGCLARGHPTGSHNPGGHSNYMRDAPTATKRPPPALSSQPLPKRPTTGEHPAVHRWLRLAQRLPRSLWHVRN